MQNNSFKKKGNSDIMMKEVFLQLVDTCKHDSDLLQIIEDDMDSFRRYIDAVYSMEYSIPIIRARYEGQDVRDRIMVLDKNRRMAHDRAIVAVKRLNRYSEMYGVHKIFQGDVEDRYQVADFCQDIVDEFFGEREGKDTAKQGGCA